MVNKDIQQSVELRPEEERFMRLLEILGTWYTQGKVLVFVQTQEQCDNLFRDLLKVRSRRGDTAAQQQAAGPVCTTWCR